MPDGGGRRPDMKTGSSRKVQRVQGPRAIAPYDLSPRQQILHRTTNGVKLNRDIVVNGKLAHRDKILNNARRNQNIIKKKRTRKLCRASESDRKQCAVADNNGGRNRIPRRVRTGESTGIGRHMGRGT